jgi:hypothetical protein
MQATIAKTFIFFGNALLNLSIIIILVTIILKYFKQRSNFKLALPDKITILTISGFSFLGFAIGLLVGLSLSPVVQVVIPALLTFYGGFLTYLLSKDAFVDSKKLITILLSAMAVSFFLIYGVEIGSIERSAATKVQNESDLKFLDKEDSIKFKYR